MKIRRPLAVSAIVALALTACGRSSSPTSGASTSSSVAAAGKGDFGSLANVCHGGSGGGATDQGVTADSIHIATFSDVGFTGRPGLNQELFDAAQVFSQWCNDAGGINGRKIVVDYRDAKLFEYKQRMIESCGQDFMMVGGGAVFDDTGQDERLSCLLPDIAGYVVEPKARGADLEIQSNPTPLNTEPVGIYRWLAKKFPDSTNAVGYLTGNVPATVTVKNEAKEAGEKNLGFKTVYDELYNPVGEATWTPFVQAMKSKGVKGLVYVGEPENLAKLEQAMADAGFYPEWIAPGANIYDQALIQTGGPAVKSTYIPVNFVPFEEASKSPALTQYLQLFDRYKPGGKSHAVLGVEAWSAWLIFATSAEKCGADLTRRCVYDNAKAIGSWNAGGLSAPEDIGAQTASDCYAAVQATPTGFQPVDVQPNQGMFNCSAANVVKLTGDYGTGAKLSDVGKSMADLK